MKPESLSGSQLRALLGVAASSTGMRLDAGTRLGPYQIIEPLGKGGMGEVYRAEDVRLNRSVAVKIVTGGAGDLTARFHREAKSVARLEHPHVCRVYDVGHDQGFDYLVMECLDGETLASRMTHGRLSIEETVGIASEIAEALAHTHQHGIVHRDLKPGNVMLTATGAKVLDFGLSKWLAPGSGAAALTVTGTIAGTLQYMSPEQIDGQPADERSDIFALGAIMYEMLAGHAAFAREQPSATIAAILHADPAPLATAAPHAPPELVSIVQKCLAKAPAGRWQAAAELATALRTSGGRSAHPSSSATTLVPSRARWAAVLALTALAGAGVWWFATSRTMARPDA